LRPSRPPVGIEKIRGYPCALELDLSLLAPSRQQDVTGLHDDLMVFSRGLNPLWEDPVTMAVNAAREMLTEEDRSQIELLIVATESSVDQGKPISTYAQRFLGIQPNCRNFEAKHGCYAGTSAVMMAAHWIASGIAPGKKALVIATDQARNSIGTPYEFVMGAGAVALLISAEPQVVEFELERNGYWTAEVSDTFRPTSKVETGNSETSLYCYLDALEGAYDHYCQKAGSIDFDQHFKKNIYHVPFGGLTFQAHRTLLRRWKRMKKSEAFEHFARKALTGLRYPSQLGGTYSASTFLSLMAMVDHCADLVAGDRVGIYAYGSGSCGEFYSARVCPEAQAMVAAADFEGLLAARQPISVLQYEELEHARAAAIDLGDFVPGTSGFDGLYQRQYEGRGRLVLRGVADYYRKYGWS
jgi:hydroxymethylglutaryl-CoA synthase